MINPKSVLRDSLDLDSLTDLPVSVFREANGARFSMWKANNPEMNLWTPEDWVTAIIGELGEYANELKKFNRRDFDFEQLQERAGRELADVITYIDCFISATNLGLGDIVLPQAGKTAWNIILNEGIAGIRIERETFKDFMRAVQEANKKMASELNPMEHGAIDESSPAQYFIKMMSRTTPQIFSQLQRVSDLNDELEQDAEGFEMEALKHGMNTREILDREYGTLQCLVLVFVGAAISAAVQLHIDIGKCVMDKFNEVSERRGLNVFIRETEPGVFTAVH